MNVMKEKYSVCITCLSITEFYDKLAECVPVMGTSDMYLSSFLKVKICKTTFEAVSMANLLLRSSNLLLRPSNLLLRFGNLLSKCSCLH